MSRDYIIHTPDEIERIRVAAAMTGKARDLIADSVRPGMSTKELDLIAGEIITSMGGKCAFLGYAGFPGNICISVNDEVVHGIGDPNRFILKGDLVKVDVGVAFNGGIGDTARTVYVGDEPSCPADERKLMDVTRDALEAGIKAALPGNHIRDISAAIQQVAKKKRHCDCPRLRRAWLRREAPRTAGSSQLRDPHARSAPSARNGSCNRTHVQPRHIQSVRRAQRLDGPHTRWKEIGSFRAHGSYNK